MICERPTFDMSELSHASSSARNRRGTVGDSSLSLICSLTPGNPRHSNKLPWIL